MQNTGNAGTHADMITCTTRVRVIQQARELIFQKGKAIKSVAVEKLLKQRSLVPIVVCENQLLLMLRH
jgi:hypothetical protein